MEAMSRPVISVTRNQNRSITERDSGYIKNPAHIHFVLCEVCYWSATFFNINKNPVVKCPHCDSIRIDSIPMSRHPLTLREGMTT
jgi:hypothetical protein